MQTEATRDAIESEPQETVSASHHRDRFEIDPGWEDVPELREKRRREIREIVADVVPGILCNAARRRYAIITSVGCQYVRYRRAGCTSTKSRREAIKRAERLHDIGESAVYEHIRALPIEDSTAITPHLERVYARYQRDLPEIARELERPCHRLVRVLSVIASIDETPGVEPSDIVLQDVYRDQPGERSRVLDADHDVIGLPRSDDEDRGALIQKAEMVLEREDLASLSTDEPVRLTDNAMIDTRDIATYDTDYSRVLREIFEAVQTEMTLRGKQKPGPTIGSRCDDNAAVRAAIPFPDSVDAPGRWFARLEVNYWRRGSSSVRVTTHPLGIVHDERDPCLSGPIDELSKPGIHSLIGETIDIVERENASDRASSV